jgi:hypothetical protein
MSVLSRRPEDSVARRCGGAAVRHVGAEATADFAAQPLHGPAVSLVGN